MGGVGGGQLDGAGLLPYLLGGGEKERRTPRGGQVKHACMGGPQNKGLGFNRVNLLR